MPTCLAAKLLDWSFISALSWRSEAGVGEFPVKPMGLVPRVLYSSFVEHRQEILNQAHPTRLIRRKNIALEQHVWVGLQYPLENLRVQARQPGGNTM